MNSTFYVVTNKAGTRFVDFGEGNSEYDEPMVVDNISKATFFDDELRANARFKNKVKSVRNGHVYESSGIEYTKAYWGNVPVARFLKTAVVKKVTITLVK